MKFKHVGCLGDVIYSLPIIKYFGNGDLYLIPNISNFIKDKEINLKAGLSMTSIQQLTPLLLRQTYIKSVNVGNLDSKIDIDIDSFRSNPKLNDRKNLCNFILQHHKVPFSIAIDPWIVCEKKCIEPYVFARTTRNRDVGNINNRKILKKLLHKHKHQAIFIGFKHEWDHFKEEIGNIPMYHCKDFNELCSVINGSQQLIANQSFPMALAIALGKSYIQEVWPAMPDCVFTRENAQYFGHPQSYPLRYSYEHIKLL